MEMLMHLTYSDSCSSYQQADGRQKWISGSVIGLGSDNHLQLAHRVLRVLEYDLLNNNAYVHHISILDFRLKGCKITIMRDYNQGFITSSSVLQMMFVLIYSLFWFRFSGCDWTPLTSALPKTQRFIPKSHSCSLPETCSYFRIHIKCLVVHLRILINIH